ncbi:shikimate kinase [Pontibacter sp. MBLB2868]|uniref:shikimate kinase n=1 Tax=Pontibacter sp. MBLB2868 TaxID=3451555 RepID=UPI003F74CC43
MRVFLIGMMGSGKTTLGRQLAKLLQYTFVDLDEYIEQQENKTIPQIFQEEGQQRFRQLERQALERLVAAQDRVVVATGGGAPCFFDNISFLNRHGENIFLDVPLDEIAKRLQLADLEQRPLLAGKSMVEVKLFLAKTLEERKRFYEQANYVISGTHITPVQLQYLLNHK